MRHILPFFLVAVVCLVAPPMAAAQLTVQTVAEGLSAPLGFVQVPANPTAQVILEQGGRVRLLKNGALQDTDYLNLSDTVAHAGGEAGLLGLAFSPEYASDGRLFVCFVDPNNRLVVARFERSADDPLQADASSRFDVMWPDGLRYIQWTAGNHYGGNLAFAADGFLYIGLGDGGAANDPEHDAQNPLSLKGKLLRLDVSVSDADPEGYDVPGSNPFAGRGDVLGEIWDLGLRNPWRWSFDDRALGGTGALVIGDVGQGSWEEVDYEREGAGGRNYGWRNREGSHDNVVDLPPFSGALTDPMFEYDHDMGHSIIGGVVYRGAALGAAYRGRYFFGDFVAGEVWSLGLNVDSGSGEVSAGELQVHPGVAGAALGLSSFGTDASGELYVVSYLTGVVSRIVQAGAPGSAPSGCSTTDPFAAMGGGSCVNGGWLPPGMSPTTEPPPPPPTSAGGCTTPDPFAAMGGGTCANGGWLPPSAPAPPAPASPPTPPPPGSTGCATPDPFVAMGGGTCVNGGWLPPSAPTPPPPAPPPPPPPSSIGCATPDPFVAMGGGTCINGGWLPPSAPAPPAPAPPAPPPPSSIGCATPDPFVVMGGGACVNGGWLPPSAPAPPAPAPPAPPPPSSIGCATPDPFVAMGGGTCVNGGWLPPGASPPPPLPLPPPTTGGCTTPDPFEVLGGGTCVNGGWLPPQ